MHTKAAAEILGYVPKSDGEILALLRPELQYGDLAALQGRVQPVLARTDINSEFREALEGLDAALVAVARFL